MSMEQLYTDPAMHAYVQVVLKQCLSHSLITMKIMSGDWHSTLDMECRLVTEDLGMCSLLTKHLI